MSESFDLTDRAFYRHWTRDRVRFQDLDSLGHVNNVTFAVYAESGRIDWAETVWPGSVAGNDTCWVIARLEIDFRAQAYYPGEVEIGTRLLRIGTSSCTVGQGLFMGDTCFGTAESVLVWTDIRNGRSVPIPPEMRRALEAS